MLLEGKQQQQAHSKFGYCQKMGGGWVGVGGVSSLKFSFFQQLKKAYLAQENGYFSMSNCGVSKLSCAT